MKKIIFCNIFCIILSLSLADIPIQVNVDKETITMGDVIHYVVAIDKSALNNKTVELVDTFSASDNITVLTKNVGQIIKKHWVGGYGLTFFSLGVHQIPTVDVIVGLRRTSIPARSIKVVSAFKKGVTKNMVMALKPQGRIKLKWWNYLYLFLFLQVIIWFFILFWPKIVARLRGDVIVVPEKIDPYKLALINLQKLEESQLWENDLKDYYFRLSFIVKEYLTLSFGLPILESTTFEIRKMLPEVLSKQLSNDFMNFLYTLDPVKYAHHQPTVNEIKGSLDQARSLLKQNEDSKVDNEVSGDENDF